MLDLTDFQAAFASAVGGTDGLRCWLNTDASDAGMAVYRNTIAKGAVDALAANFPTIERLVGAEWLRGAALAYWALEAPGTPVLGDYGERFPAFLETFEPARQMPFLADVACIDRLWTEAHRAADAAPASLDELASLEGDALMTMRLGLHPAARLGAFATPAATYWRLNRPPAPIPGENGWTIDWKPEAILLTRPAGAVLHRVLTAADVALLLTLQSVATVADGVEAARTAEPDADPWDRLAEALAVGALVMA